MNLSKYLCYVTGLWEAGCRLHPLYRGATLQPRIEIYVMRWRLRYYSPFSTLISLPQQLFCRAFARPLQYRNRFAYLIQHRRQSGVSAGGLHIVVRL